MKKVIFGIFAHPDDEAFGPCGTLLQEQKNGADIHLVSLTRGDAGTNPDDVPDLGVVREQEWRNAGKLISAKSMTYLGYLDGQLNNQAMIEVGHKLVEHVQTILQATPEDVEIEFISLDLGGLTGHIDHIVAARAACWAFYTLRKHGQPMSRIHLYCFSDSQNPTSNTDWLFMDAGHPESIIETIDASQYREEILAIMQCHHSQRADYEAFMSQHSHEIGVDHFMILE